MKKSVNHIHVDKDSHFFSDLDQIIEYVKYLTAEKKDAVDRITKKTLIKALENTKEEYHIVKKYQSDNIVERPATTTFDWSKNIDVSYSNKQYGLYQLCPKMRWAKNCK